MSMQGLKNENDTFMQQFSVKIVAYIKCNVII
jgi:hypothetical protein